MELQDYDRAVEVDEKYKDEQRAQQLKIQEQLLVLERQRFRRALIIACITLFFTSILVYYYLRLRKANRTTRQQSQNLIRSMARQLKGQVESQNDGGASYTIFFQEKNVANLV